MPEPKIKIETYPIRISISKERKKLLSTGEVREYKRIRGYVEFYEMDALEKWVAIKKKDLETFKKLLVLFNDLLEVEFSIEITKEEFHELYKALQEYEEKNDDAWVYHYGIPKIYYFLRGLIFAEWRPFRTLKQYLEEHEIEGIDPDKLKDEVFSLLEKIEDELWKRYEKLGISEFTDMEALDYNEFVVEMRFNEIRVSKRGQIILDKDDDKYILEISMDGSCDIDYICIR